MEQAVAARIPPISADGHRRDPVWRDGLALLLDTALNEGLPSPAAAVVAELRARSAVLHLGLRISCVLELCAAFGGRVLGEDLAAGVGDRFVPSRFRLSQQSFGWDDRDDRSIGEGGDEGVGVERLVGDQGAEIDGFDERLSAQIQPKNPAPVRLRPLLRTQSHRAFFNKLKHFRAIATRYDKLAKIVLVAVHLACAAIPPKLKTRP